MNILMLTTHLNAGGIASYLAILSKGLVDRGHRVIVGSSGGDREEDFRNIGVTLVGLSVRTKSEMSPLLWLSVPKVLNVIREHDVDVIHAHTRVTQVLAWTAGRLSHKPYVATCHGFFKPRFFRRMIRCWGDRTIAISPAVQRHLVDDFAISPSTIDQVTTGIELDKYRIPTEELRLSAQRRWGLYVDEKVIGIIARLSDVKGQDILLRAMPRVVRDFPNVKLALIGEGKMETELKQLSDTLRLQKNVLFFPIVNQTVEWLAALDIFVMPSRKEGLGLSVMEAQAMGLPVVASRTGGLESLVEDGVTGFLVDPENPEALAEALLRLLKNPALSRSIGSAARRKAEQEYGAEKMVEKIIKVYEKV